MDKINIEIEVNVGIKKAWEDYTNPESIKGWAFASDDWECLYAENDLKMGGRFLSRMSSKDKTSSFDFTGTYTEVIPQEKIKYKMDKEVDVLDGRVCEILFESIGEHQTKLKISFDPENINPIDMQKSGWQSILNNFKKFTESH